MEPGEPEAPFDHCRAFARRAMCVTEGLRYRISFSDRLSWLKFRRKVTMGSAGYSSTSLRPTSPVLAPVINSRVYTRIRFHAGEPIFDSNETRICKLVVLLAFL